MFKNIKHFWKIDVKTDWNWNFDKKLGKFFNLTIEIVLNKLLSTNQMLMHCNIMFTDFTEESKEDKWQLLIIII